MDPFLRIFRVYAPRHAPSYLIGLLAMFATNWITVTIPLEVGAAIDALRTDAALGVHARNVVLMGFVVIVVRTLSRVLFFNPGRDIEHDLRRDLFGHLLRLQPSFYAGRRTGDIVSRASNDITFARVLVGFGLMQAVNVTFALSLTLWRMGGISVQLTLMAFIPVVACMAVVQLALRKLFVWTRRQQAELGAISNQVLESFQGIATIQGFVAEQAFTDRFEEKNAAWFATGMKLAMLRSLVFPLLMLGGGLAVFVVLRWGGLMVVDGVITLGQLAAFTTLLGALVPSLRSLGWMLSVIQRGRASLERIFEILDGPIDRPEGDNGVVLGPTCRPGFQLRGLSFAYPDEPDELVLHDLNVDIPAGGVVGIFGRTGSGKTTLLRVLTRLYNPLPGMVMVDPGDGREPLDLRALDLDAWRDTMVLAPQRPFLFSDRISVNVALEEDPDLERVRAAVGSAALGTDLESLPDGLDTVVGERGIMLSGGQRQRTALARALYREAGVIALDDVLSAVDHETEARLVGTLQGLGDEGGGPTTLIVSHRLSAIRHADLIIVLEDGRLVDQGTHAELCRRPGLYQDTWKVQESNGADHPGAVLSAGEAS